MNQPTKQVMTPVPRVLSFEQMPAALAHLIDEVSCLKLMLENRDTKPQEEPESKYIYSIRGLAKFLNCSQVTAQKLKNEGQIKYRQIGRKVIFERQEVLKAMENHIPGNRSRNYQRS